VLSDESIRRKLLENKNLLGTLVTGLRQRKSRKYSATLVTRFRECDSMLCSILSDVEHEFGRESLVFSAWLSHQRRMGLDVANRQDETIASQSRQEVDRYRQIRESRSLFSDFDDAFRQLERLVEVLTPDLEDVFRDEDPQVTVDRTAGSNEDVYALASEKYNLISKKLLPRLNRLVSESPPEVVQGAEKRIQQFRTSDMMNRFLLVLASKQSTTSVNEPEKDYDDWF
jgi:hypothetical protein